MAVRSAVAGLRPTHLRSGGVRVLRRNGRVSEPADLTYRLGGNIGRRARRSGFWFDPVVWSLLAATLTWLVVILRQVPCRPTADGFPNAFLRLCYSDIPILYLGRGISTGADFYTEVALEYPVLIGYFMAAARGVTGFLGGEVSSAATYEQQVAASQVFFQVTAVGLFICFLVTVAVHLRLAGPTRAWDALLIAASPVVMANALINWDLLAVMLTALGLLFWQRRNPVISGGLLGLAFAAKFYPVLVLVAITLLCVRAGRHRVIGQVWATALLTWSVVNVPIMVAAWGGWAEFWAKNAARGADLGSIWYVLGLVGLSVPAVSAIAFAGMAAGGIAIIWLVLKAPRRPRLGQVALLLLVVFLVFNKVYSPQYALWLLPLVVLARPKLFDVSVWTLGEIGYFVSIWGFLHGALGPGRNPEWIYWVAVILRIFIQLWFALRVVDDIMRPWEDPVRLPMVDDPIGGVLDHAPDARWAALLETPRAAVP